MVAYGFHPEALEEYTDAINYYLGKVSPEVAEAFVTAVESAVGAIIAAPDRCPVFEEPDVRRYVFRRFPYVLYYRWEAERQRVTIYAVMHCSREPAYWKHRIA